ncbi:E3 ubiquitin-protein ligase TRIM71 [Holothuria leucospilota]|uniref:E3 ubiquitin-protein ligase TRIM71 n=1 Tax=Holothuria leucospilota TaxID=206669 RepID=A0A9Q1BT05_HOLLE|nr:E3 ubiquitin-protein ligase TRIM71 [Holothuria leucospilota]
MRECYGCSKQVRVTAYCFKCNDFLCQDCHNFHVKNKLLKDHQKHTLSLEDIESKSITIEKLASMRDSPRCLTHPEKISELYCKTCDNLPVCMACMLGVHKGHDLHEVRALAKSTREMLAQKLETLEKLYEERNITVPGQAKEKLLSNVKCEKESLLKMYESQVKKIKMKIDDVEERREEIKVKKQNTEKQIFDSLQREKEKEIEMVNKKYEELFKLKKIESSNLLKDQESSVERELAQLMEKLYHFNRDKEQLLESIKIELNKNLKDIETTLEYFENTTKRFKNLQALGSSIIASENDWTAALCIPDVQAAADNLIKDLKKDFPKLQTLSNVKINYKQLSFGKPTKSKISVQIESKIILNDTYFYINGVTSSGEGNIVISGCPSGENEAFIIVIDLNGKVLRQKKIISGYRRPWHMCDFLSQTKVAIVCYPNIVGVHDIFDDSYNVRNINDVISSWPKGRHVKCVATDAVNNHILVGGEDSRDVYVFDDQLNYLYILTLPEMIKWLHDITVCDGHLLVCDYKGGKAYVTTMDENKCSVVGEFKKPDLVGLKPLSVCTDKICLAYMLWRQAGLLGQCYLVQYNFDGSQLITTRKMDDRACFTAVADTTQGEKLVVATHDTQKVYLYGLLDED